MSRIVIPAIESATGATADIYAQVDERLAGRDWVMGADYSIADISRRASSSASTDIFMCRRGSTAASPVRLCSADCA